MICLPIKLAVVYEWDGCSLGYSSNKNSTLFLFKIEHQIIWRLNKITKNIYKNIQIFVPILICLF